MGSFEEQLLFCKLSAVDSFKLLRGTGVSDIRVCGRVASKLLLGGRAVRLVSEADS